jgi:hypothetical protein
MVIQFIKDWALLSFLLLNATWVYFGFIMRLRQVRDEGIWIKATRAASNVAEATAGMQASEIVWPL